MTLGGRRFAKYSSASASIWSVKILTGTGVSSMSVSIGIGRLPLFALARALAHDVRQHAEVERLRKKCADRLGKIAAYRLAGRGHDDDPLQVGRLFLADVAHDAVAVDAGHHQVDHEEIVAAGIELLDRLLPVVGGVDRELLAPQDRADQRADGQVVLTDERAFHRLRKGS